MFLSPFWICLLLSSVSRFPDTHPCLVIPCLLLFPVGIWLVFIIFMLFMSIQCCYLSSLSTCSTCSFDGQRTLASPLFCSPYTPWALPLLCHICIFSVILGLPAGAHVSRAVTLAPTLPASSYPLGWRKTRDFQGSLPNCSFRSPMRAMFWEPCDDVLFCVAVLRARCRMDFSSTCICL